MTFDDLLASQSILASEYQAGICWRHDWEITRRHPGSVRSQHGARIADAMIGQARQRGPRVMKAIAAALGDSGATGMSRLVRIGDDLRDINHDLGEAHVLTMPRIKAALKVVVAEYGEVLA